MRTLSFCILVVLTFIQISPGHTAHFLSFKKYHLSTNGLSTDKSETSIQKKDGIKYLLTLKGGLKTISAPDKAKGTGFAAGVGAQIGRRFIIDLELKIYSANYNTSSFTTGVSMSKSEYSLFMFGPNLKYFPFSSGLYCGLGLNYVHFDKEHSDSDNNWQRNKESLTTSAIEATIGLMKISSKALSIFSEFEVGFTLSNNLMRDYDSNFQVILPTRTIIEYYGINIGICVSMYSPKK